MKQGFACIIASLVIVTFGGVVRGEDKPQPISAPSGALRPATAADFAPRSEDGAGFLETWNYLFFLDGDLQLYVRFSQANLGSVKGRVCGARLSVVGLDGESYAVAREYPIANLEYRGEDQSLRVHRNLWVRGVLPEGHRLHFETSKNGVSYVVDLTLSDIEAGWVWGDGIFHLGEDEALGLFVHIPHASVKGSVTVNSVSREVQGSAYMDHTYQTTWLSHLFKSGFRYVINTGHLESGYLFMPSDRYQPGVVGYGIVNADDRPKLLVPDSLTGSEEKGNDAAAFGKRISIRYQSGELLELELVDIRQRLSVLDDIGALAKVFAKAFLKGEVVQVRGPGRVNGTLDGYLDYFFLR